MNPLIQDILRRHLAQPSQTMKTYKSDKLGRVTIPEEGSCSERDLGGPPWRCPNCHRLNTNERKQCKQCESRKPNQTLCEVFTAERSNDQTPFF